MKSILLLLLLLPVMAYSQGYGGGYGDGYGDGYRGGYQGSMADLLCGDDIIRSFAPGNGAEATPDSGSVDFAFIYEEDEETYHIFNIPGGHITWRLFTQAAWFQHYTSTDLIEWEKQDNINLYDATYAKNNVWAPQIIKLDETYYMFYTAVDHAGSAIANRIERIMMTTSTDLYTWTSGVLILEGDTFASGVTVFTTWGNVGGYADHQCRDQCIIRNPDDDGWLMYLTVKGTGGAWGGSIIAMAQSLDGAGTSTESLTSTTGWELFDYLVQTTGDPRGEWGYGPESPQVWDVDGTYFLQFTTNDPVGGRMITTTTPELGSLGGNSWTAHELYDVKAPENIKTADGEYTVAYLSENDIPPGDSGQFFDIYFNRMFATSGGELTFSNSVAVGCWDWATPPAAPEDTDPPVISLSILTCGIPNANHYAQTAGELVYWQRRLQTAGKAFGDWTSWTTTASATFFESFAVTPGSFVVVNSEVRCKDESGNISLASEKSYTYTIGGACP